nr:hypothetical protein Iba_chr02aCG8070 [Ipomoea batatas]GMC62768.1 hypothetical protein Iba_chr02cCG6960 [Ipomoea batatas]
MEFSCHLMNSILLYSFYPLEKAKHCITGFYKPQGSLLHLIILPEAILAMEVWNQSLTPGISSTSPMTF